MFDAATAPAETLKSDPNREVPPQLGNVLGVVRALIAYGKNFADTLRQHAADPRLLPCIAFVALTFATTDIAAVLARVTRGLLRAAALEERLRRRAARGQELKPTPTRLPQPKRRASKPAAQPHDPAQDPNLASPLTTEQILAHDRRRPIGAVLVEICRDLGITPGQTDPATGRAVILYGGSLGKLVLKRKSWQALMDSASRGDIPIAADGQPIIVRPPWPAHPPNLRGRCLRPPKSPLPLREGVGGGGLASKALSQATHTQSTHGTGPRPAPPSRFSAGPASRHATPLRPNR